MWIMRWRFASEEAPTAAAAFLSAAYISLHKF